MIAQCLSSWVCASGLGGAIGWAVSGALTYAWDVTTTTAGYMVANYGCTFFGNISACF